MELERGMLVRTQRYKDNQGTKRHPSINLHTGEYIIIDILWDGRYLCRDANKCDFILTESQIIEKYMPQISVYYTETLHVDIRKVPEILAKKNEIYFKKTID